MIFLFSCSRLSSRNQTMFKLLYDLFIFMNVAYSQLWSFGSENIVVTISDGQIKGQKLFTYTNKTFYSFQKIPYATPPLGDLRFKGPIPPQKWNKILDASGFLDVKCFQTSSDDSTENEDCLYLNVYTPKLPTKDDDETLPVLVYIFGGAFLDGNPLFTTTGPHFFMDEYIVVVTLNYRVGVFGFSATGDSVLPGNAGLKDQKLAIQWVHDNIRSFGGNPDQVTINGLSSGAASVTYQLLHNKNANLFRGAIVESGACLSPWALQRDPKFYAVKTAAELDPSFTNSSDSARLLKFLQTASARDLDAAAKRVNDWAISLERQAYLGRTYAPVLEYDHEDAFITEKMYVKIKSGDVVKVPLMAGFNSLESVGNAANLISFKKSMAAYDEHLDWLVPEDMRIQDLANRTEIGSQIRDIYTGGEVLQDHLLGGVEFISDNRYTRPVRKFAELFALIETVFFYQFSYNGVMGLNNASVEGVTGAAHAENYNYLWHINLGSYDNGVFPLFPTEDVETLKRMVRMWANFVKILNPTPSPSDILLQNITWPTVSSGAAGDFLVMNIDKDLRIINKPKDVPYQKWGGIYSGLGYDDFDTY